MGEVEELDAYTGGIEKRMKMDSKTDLIDNRGETWVGRKQ
jgi:hypothetical protein